jgi:Protein of unknown function (DUF1573)
MERTYFFLLFFILKHVSSQALLSFEHETVLLGKVPEGPSFEILFQFKNIGKSPLIISNVQSSCGCVVTSWPKNPILPNEGGTIIANFLSKGHLGRIHKNIAVMSNDTTNPSMPLFFKGEVVTGMNLQKLIFTTHNSLDTIAYTPEQKMKVQVHAPKTHGILLEVHNTDSLPAYLQLPDSAPTPQKHFCAFWSLKPKGPKTRDKLIKDWNKLYFRTIILQPHSKQSIYFQTDPASKAQYNPRTLYLLVNETTFDIQIIPEIK